MRTQTSFVVRVDVSLDSRGRGQAMPATQAVHALVCSAIGPLNLFMATPAGGRG